MQESLNELISREWSTAQLSSELQQILGQKLHLDLDRWWRKPAKDINFKVGKKTVEPLAALGVGGMVCHLENPQTQ